jgi:hypothetical protein
MKKQQFKNLALRKKTVSNLIDYQLKGGRIHISLPSICYSIDLWFDENGNEVCTDIWKN